MKDNVYQLAVDINFVNKAVNEVNDVMLKINNAIARVVEEESLKLITDLNYCWEPTDAYDTVDME